MESETLKTQFKMMTGKMINNGAVWASRDASNRVSCEEAEEEELNFNKYQSSIAVEKQIKYSDRAIYKQPAGRNCINYSTSTPNLSYFDDMTSEHQESDYEYHPKIDPQYNDGKIKKTELGRISLLNDIYKGNRESQTNSFTTIQFQLSGLETEEPEYSSQYIACASGGTDSFYQELEEHERAHFIAVSRTNIDLPYGVTGSSFKKPYYQSNFPTIFTDVPEFLKKGTQYYSNIAATNSHATNSGTHSYLFLIDDLSVPTYLMNFAEPEDNEESEKVAVEQKQEQKQPEMQETIQEETTFTAAFKAAHSQQIRLLQDNLRVRQEKIAGKISKVDVVDRQKVENNPMQRPLPTTSPTIIRWEIELKHGIIPNFATTYPRAMDYQPVLEFVDFLCTQAQKRKNNNIYEEALEAFLLDYYIPKHWLVSMKMICRTKRSHGVFSVITKFTIREILVCLIQKFAPSRILDAVLSKVAAYVDRDIQLRIMQVLLFNGDRFKMFDVENLRSKYPARPKPTPPTGMLTADELASLPEDSAMRPTQELLQSLHEQSIHMHQVYQEKVKTILEKAKKQYETMKPYFEKTLKYFAILTRYFPNVLPTLPHIRDLSYLFTVHKPARDLFRDVVYFEPLYYAMTQVVADKKIDLDYFAWTVLDNNNNHFYINNSNNCNNTNDIYNIYTINKQEEPATTLFPAAFTDHRMLAEHGCLAMERFIMWTNFTAGCSLSSADGNRIQVQKQVLFLAITSKIRAYAQWSFEDLVVTAIQLRLPRFLEAVLLFQQDDLYCIVQKECFMHTVMAKTLLSINLEMATILMTYIPWKTESIMEEKLQLLKQEPTISTRRHKMFAALQQIACILEAHSFEKYTNMLSSSEYHLKLPEGLAKKYPDFPNAANCPYLIDAIRGIIVRKWNIPFARTIVSHPVNESFTWQEAVRAGNVLLQPYNRSFLLIERE